ncbi:MAG: glycosyltransferase family 9 protein, partial [Fidelibacterota bacterium]
MNDPQRILLIRFSSIGDIVQSTCILKPLKRYWPKSTLVFLTLERFAPILESHPSIDEIICIPKTFGRSGLKDIGNSLQSLNFDVVFDLHRSLRSRIILSVMNGSQLFTIRKPRLNRQLLIQWHWNRFPEDWTFRRLFTRPLEEAGVPVDHTDTPFLGMHTDEIDRAKTYLASRGIGPAFLVCVPGAAWRQKTLPVDSLVRALKPLAGIPIVILGTRRDVICYRLAERLPEALNLAGKTNLRRSLAILAGARRVVGSDTGLVHAAEALGVPVTMILGPTTREMGGGTWSSASWQIETDLWC